MTLSIKVLGDKRLRAKLRGVSNANLRPPMLKSVTAIEKDAKEYPAVRPNSTYRRTGQLGRSWGWTITGRGFDIEGIVKPGAKYAPFVQSALFQAAIHRNLWKNTDRNIVNKRKDQILNYFTDHVKKLLR